MKRDDFSMPLAFPGELIIDNFAGGGGTSTGLEQAFGRPVDIAINHDPEALAMHAMNHPHTMHLCESVWDVDPIKVTKNQPVGLVWLSPDCKHFSKAKGGTPVRKDIRGLAWVGVRWVIRTKPRAFMLENVEEFQTWGPLLIDEHGLARPDPGKRGQTFRVFKQMLTTGVPLDERDHNESIDDARDSLCTGLLALTECEFAQLLDGMRYSVECAELKACDYDTPTIRKRFFMVGRRDGLPVVARPEVTNAASSDPKVTSGKLKPWRTAAECIDFTLEAKSIFGRKKELAVNTQRRVAKGLWRHVLNSASPFIVNTRNGERAGQEPRIRSVEEPYWTVTGMGSQGALAQPSLAPFITEHANASDQRTMPADEPLRTQLAQVKGGHFSVVAPALAPLRGTSEQHLGGHDVKAPLSTISAGGTHHALVAAHLVDMGHGEGKDGTKRFSHGVRSLEVPLNTVTASGATSALVAACLEQANGGFYDGDGRPVDAPISTITGRGTQQRLIAAYCVKYYSSGGQWQGLAEPMHTLPTKGRMGLVEVLQVPVDCLSPEHRARALLCAALLHAHLPEHFTQPAELVLVAINGQWWVLVDITLRMLKPRELYRAQGFPEGYVIDEIPDPTLLFKDGHQVAVDPLTVRRIPLNTTAQVRMCGNSVCPPQARALALANFTHELGIKPSGILPHEALA